jgi:hypothetical protein
MVSTARPLLLERGADHADIYDGGDVSCDGDEGADGFVVLLPVASQTSRAAVR